MASTAAAPPPSAIPVINIISPGASSSSSSPVIVASPSSSHASDLSRPMADPLPSKVGEIGYMPPIEEDTAEGGNTRRSSTDGMNAAEADARNGRHPADTSRTNLAAGGGSSSRNASHTTINMPMPPKSVTSRIWSKKFSGISVRSIVQCTTVLSIIIGTIVGWVFAAKAVADSSHNTNGSNNGNNSNNNGNNNNGSSISPIFLHLLFAVVVIIELIVFERCLFRVRAERYAHMHPGEMLPLHRNAAMAQIAARGMPLAPWNRPSLPTYAAALGFRGTGDVEDALIAAPPPPAYGNTRGSTLLLTTIVQNRSSTSLSERPDSSDNMPSRRSSMHSEDSMPGRPSASTSEVRGDRPISYNTSEYQSSIRQAQQLEETLTRSQENIAGRR